MSRVLVCRPSFGKKKNYPGLWVTVNTILYRVEPPTGLNKPFDKQLVKEVLTEARAKGFVAQDVPPSQNFVSANDMADFLRKSLAPPGAAVPAAPPVAPAAPPAGPPPDTQFQAPVSWFHSPQMGQMMPPPGWAQFPQGANMAQFAPGMMQLPAGFSPQMMQPMMGAPVGSGAASGPQIPGMPGYGGCHICQDPGHTAASCPLKKQKTEQDAAKRMKEEAEKAAAVAAAAAAAAQAAGASTVKKVRSARVRGRERGENADQSSPLTTSEKPDMDSSPNGSEPALSDEPAMELSYQIVESVQPGSVDPIAGSDAKKSTTGNSS
eukprot:5297535-Prymnesium_polylepis.1